MAAYGALVSVMQIIDQLQLHPHPPITLPKEQVESLTGKVTFLQDFLERYSHVNSKEVDDLESRIAAAAYAAEDVIESHIVDQIHDGSTSDCAEKFTSVDFYQGVQKVIEDLDSIKKVAMVINEEIEVHQQDQLHRTSTISAASSRSASASTGQKKTVMVGFDDLLIQMLDKLIDRQPDRQIIPIVGMGGSGKTTLARNIYENMSIIYHFDIVAWVTVSQGYSLRNILVEILGEGGDDEAELEIKLNKKLIHRRYLIILDDIWDIEVWHLLKRSFPDDGNGSRIIVTTRLSNLAFQRTGSVGLEMNLLDENKSWELFCKLVFGEEECPPNLKESAKIIVENCKGLPLSIVVVGGLLAESEKKQEYWEHIAEGMNRNVYLEDQELSLQILHQSYNFLPVSLKPCFLFMGVFSKDNEIRRSKLIKLWVAGGFLKAIRGKSMEEVAEEYLKELVDRSLILVNNYGSNGKIKSFTIHNLVREMCLREAQKHKFLCVLRLQSFDIPQDINMGRCICSDKSTFEKKYFPKFLRALRSASLVRSVIWDSHEPSPSFSFRLLRVSSMGHTKKSPEAYLKQVNLRYLYLRTSSTSFSEIPSSVSLLWNLQTLKVDGLYSFVRAPYEIWMMLQLRHIEIKFLELPDPPTRDGRDDDIVLENLQTLSWINNFKCGEDVVQRIPNIKKLKIYYEELKEGSTSNYCLNNLGRLHELERLNCKFHRLYPASNLMQNLTFPHSLKKLTLEGTKLEWEEVTTRIGSLRLLEVLKLKKHSCIGREWETVEGQFLRLKFLLIDQCYDLKYWITESFHFPRLECLVLIALNELEEIPLSVGDIPTLQSIRFFNCADSAADSANIILEEQRDYGNDDIQVRDPWD